MDDLARIRALLDRQLEDAIVADPLAALVAIAATQRELEARQQSAVRRAAPDHTWAEIGAALGVSKQAAQQRFAKVWANTLKEELKVDHKAMKVAIREGAFEAAAVAKAKRDAVITEFKSVNRRDKQK